MAFPPAHPESLDSLRQLQQEAKQRGDQCLALLLAGVEMYLSVGREWELLEIMRNFAHDAEDMVRNTPTAEELRSLYQRADQRPDR
jgi:hypothetical protein